MAGPGAGRIEARHRAVAEIVIPGWLIMNIRSEERGWVYFVCIEEGIGRRTT
jgi:hypothetical protein